MFRCHINLSVFSFSEMAQFKCLQCNIQSLAKNKEELERVLKDGNYSAAFISETWTHLDLEETSKYNISQYHRFLKSRADNYGGCAIFLKENLGYSIITLPPTNDSIQTVAVKVYTLNLVLVAVYISPSATKTEIEIDLENLFQCLRQFNKVIIAGDFNAHHVTWGNDNNDLKGVTIMNLVNDHNVILLNDGSKTFVPIQINKKPSSIDLTICTPNLVTDSTWKTLDSSIGSHHLLIEIEVQTRLPEKPKYCYNYKKIRQEVNLININNCPDIESFQTKVFDIHKRNRIRNKYTPKHWWSDELSKAWEDKKVARSSFNKISTLENLLTLKKAQAVFNRLKKEEKKKNFKGFVEELNPTMSSSDLWLKIGRLTGKRKKNQTNNILYEDNILADSFLDKHFGANDPYFNVDSTFKIDYNLFDFNRFNNILLRKKKHSAPGEDLISYSMLRELKPEIKIGLIKQLNSIWKDCYLPMSLKTIKIVAVPKPGRDQATVEGKRPISLVPTLTKLTNAAVLEKLVQYLNENSLIPETSFGFRKHTSTITCLNYVINSVQSNKRNKTLTAIVFMDLTNAFNAVKTDILEQILYNFNIPIEISSWILQFLRNRKILFETRDHTLTRFVSNGLPQGDVLSPTLFNIYTAALHNTENPDAILVQYADDFGLIVRAKNLHELNIKVQEQVDILNSKLKDLNFTINPSKTKIILFQNSNNSLTIKIDGIDIETVKSHPYLGITIDRYLSFGIHIKNTKQKIVDRLNMIKVISSIKHGAHPETMITIYKAIFRSIIEYGSTIYNNARKTNKQILNTINNQCLRKITGCTKTTPLNSLMAIAATQPLELRHHFVACKEIARCIANENSIAKQLTLVNDNDSNTLTYLETVYLEEKDIFNKISPMKDINKNNYQITIEPELPDITTSKISTNPIKLKQTALGLIYGKYKDRPSIFTDASKSKTSCGIGIYITHSKHRYSYKLDNETCITTAELIALETALTFIDKNQILSAVIYTDSKSACQMIEAGLHSNRIPNLLYQIIIKANKWQTLIQWIPSHVNILGNEIADELAKQGLTATSTISNSILLKDAFGIFQHKLYTKTNLWYREYSENKGKTFFNFQQTIENESWFYNKNLTNHQTRLLNRLLSGHDWSKYWKAKMKIVDDENCEICDEPENGCHIVLHCNRFGRTRAKYSFDCKFRTLIELFNTRDLNYFTEICDFLAEIEMDI